MSRLLSAVAINRATGVHGRNDEVPSDVRSRRSLGVTAGTLRGAPGGIRNPNLLIRSQMLYPLSYGRMPRRAGTSLTGGRGPLEIGQTSVAGSPTCQTVGWQARTSSMNCSTPGSGTWMTR